MANTASKGGEAALQPGSKVAVLGLGTMGAGMASNLIAAGFAVSGYNRSRERAAPLTGKGLTLADDPAAAVAGRGAALACLADDSALASILFDQGAIQSLRPGSLLIDTGTTSLEMTNRIMGACDERGIAFIDAPVTGSKLGAEGGTLTLMVGGPESRLERGRALFEAVGKTIIHAGPRTGDGQRIKLCLNMTQAIVLQGVLEGYALAEAQGVSMEALETVFTHSAARTGVGHFKTPFLKRGDFTPHFRLDLMQKDVHLALGEASRHRLPVPLARAVGSVYDLAARQGLGPEDFLATAKLLGL